MIDINYVAVGVATVAAFVLSTACYIAFGRHRSSSMNRPVRRAPRWGISSLTPGHHFEITPE